MSESLTKEAQDWFRELPYLKRLQIPRCLQEKTKTVNALALHTFVDASENAYGAVVYARYSYEDGSLSSNIVAAKTRVAPTNATSIPRLELMGAVVGVRMAKRISATLDIPMNTSVFWSDSVNVLWWVRGRSRQFKPFVANRVGEIQSISDPAQWRYVPTSINPADFLSRGMKAEDLKKCDVWCKGPEYLLQPETAWPSNRTVNGPIENAELKLGSKLKTPKEIPMTTNHTESQRYEPTFQAFVTTIDSDAQPTIDPRRYSSWLKLRRITAWMMRFLSNCQRKKEERIAGELTEGELKVAEIQLIKEAQREEFTEEYKALTGRRSIPSRSKLLGLTPMLDEDGLIRSNGRLTNAKFLSFDVRYPVILPRKGWVTKLIIKDVHEQGNRASGTNHTLAALSARYWIVSGREAIREWEKECIMCRRRKSKACQPIMAPLPVSRIKTSLRAFTKTAVDYGGPFVTVQGRGKRREKRYLCLFTCMTSRAVHLEIAYGLDTDSFLNAFFRMASRRGLPETMYSDNGTNFKGADKELKSLLTQLDQTKINSSIANNGVKWYFNPPLAPHFGGVHESMMKSAKRAINAILGNADITDEELMTAIIGAEGLINSRPLTYQTADPSDDVPLTPNHFLHGQAGGQFAPTSTDETDFNPRRRWRRVQELVRHFWHRWLREWLPELSGWRKWIQPGRDVKVGDVVLVVSPETARGNWPLGRILETYPGKDGQVRVAKIQVGQGTMTRAVTKLCPLELEN